jgi:acyl carrier protein
VTPVELHALTAEVLGIGADRVRGDLSFGDIPEWDSLAHVDLMLALGIVSGPRSDPSRWSS